MNMIQTKVSATSNNDAYAHTHGGRQGERQGEGDGNPPGMVYYPIQVNPGFDPFADEDPEPPAEGRASTAPRGTQEESYPPGRLNNITCDSLGVSDGECDTWDDEELYGPGLNDVAGFTTAVSGPKRKTGTELPLAAQFYVAPVQEQDQVNQEAAAQPKPNYGGFSPPPSTREGNACTPTPSDSASFQGKERQREQAKVGPEAPAQPRRNYWGCMRIAPQPLLTNVHFRGRSTKAHPLRRTRGASPAMR